MCPIPESLGHRFDPETVTLQWRPMLELGTPDPGIKRNCTFWSPISEQNREFHAKPVIEKLVVFLFRKVWLVIIFACIIEREDFAAIVYGRIASIVYEFVMQPGEEVERQ